METTIVVYLIILLYLSGMDKTMKRVIGYVPSAVKKNLPPKTKEIEVEVEKVVIVESGETKVELDNIPDLIKTKSKKIVSWIDAHKEFKWSAMCRELKIDKSNFQRVLTSEAPEIKISHITAIEAFLKRYGYVG